MKQITIVGTGLIGGSLALALKKDGFKGRIVGCDRASVLKRAKRMRAIDSGFEDPKQAAAGSHVVVLAMPVGAILDFIRSYGAALQADTLLTDVGSTKVEVVKCAQKVFGQDAGRRFLAGHPMAGKERGGIESADAELFCGAAWFVTPFARQQISRGRAGEFLRWVRRCGARIAPLDAEAHDHLCARISHLPQMLSTALAAALLDEFGDGRRLATGGRALREMTRIAASPYSMWRDIAHTNTKNIAAALLRLEQKLAYLRENLRGPELREEFKRANRFRLT